MTGDAQHCSFVLLADFDIDRGAQLTYQFPQPLGTDEGLLANLMLPDGAEKQPEDWTIFFLNQTPFNTIAPVLALDDDQTSHSGELLYVLNLVRTKLDKTARRGAVVKAMAICTRHPFIQIFKPVLLMALDDYFANPSQDCLARLFDAVNSMDISRAPVLTRHEKLIMRTSERKDVFIEKFDEFVQNSLEHAPVPGIPVPNPPSVAQHTHHPNNSMESHSSFEEGIMMRTRDAERENRAKERELERLAQDPGRPGTQKPGQYSPSDGSFSLDGSAVWVGDESGLDQVATSVGSTMSASAVRGRRSTDASSSSSHGPHGRREESTPALTAASISAALLKDAHFFPAVIDYNDHQLPIRLPLSTFPEEVGDYSLIQLVQTFSNTAATMSGPMHPHLHTSGAQTPPIIVLFNALVTGKRIIFLGHHRPAGEVCSYVLSACALGSGCGIVLRGFIKRAFPYANLTNREEWESIPGYIAGVTNPIFEALASWDLLCDVGSGRMVVSKDIHINFPATSIQINNPNQLIIRTGTLKAEGSLGSEEEIVRPSGSATAPKAEYSGKGDSQDNMFVEDITAAISYHYGEAHVRARFTEYATRFVRLVARYEEDLLGAPTIGWPSSAYTVGSNGERRLGSGIAFIDEATCIRELQVNASRIEGFRRTESYKLFQQDFKNTLATNPIQGFDVAHQLWRLRLAKRMSDGEAELIMRTIADNLQTYDQVTELLSLLPPHHNGLLPLSFGLFHQEEAVRELTVDILNVLRSYPIGVQFLHALNPFQRYAYVRQAHAREARLAKDHNSLGIPQSSYMSRTPSNRSESSLGGG